MNYTTAREQICDEITGILSAVRSEEVDRLVEAIHAAERVFFIGVGRVMLALQATAKRLAHLGVDTVVVGQITEPAITSADLLIVGSGSGESAVPVAIARKAKEHSATVAHIGSNPDGALREYTDLFVRIPVQTKLSLPGEIPSIQPMTSAFEQCLLLLGDCVALMLVKQQGLDMHSLWRFHANLE